MTLEPALHRHDAVLDLVRLAVLAQDAGSQAEEPEPGGARAGSELGAGLVKPHHLRQVAALNRVVAVVEHQQVHVRERHPADFQQLKEKLAGHHQYLNYAAGIERDERN